MTQVLLDGLSVLSKNFLLVLALAGTISLGSGIHFLFSGKVKQKPSFRRSLPFLLPILVFSFSLIARLAYLKEIFVPPYFDSVEHLRIIKALVDGFRSSALLDLLPHLTPSYYHLGFHVIVSLLTLGLRADPISVMLVFGQFILAALPIPVFFLIRNKTQNSTAAFFALLLAGFGWYMPGFAINWGKYPALTGLLFFEIVLMVAHIYSQKKTPQNQHLVGAALVFGTLFTILTHSRTLILFFISLLSHFLARKISQHQILKIEILGILILGFQIYREPLLKLALEPYLNEGWVITAIVFLLTPCAFYKYPRRFHFNILFILFLFASLFIPVHGLLVGPKIQTLLDRPFVEMILYLPLSFLVGLGLPGLSEAVKEIKFLVNNFPALHPMLRVGSFYAATRSIARRIAGLFFGEFKFWNCLKGIYKHIPFLISFFILVFAGVFSFKNYNFYPSDCCNFVGYDDTIVFEWMTNNLPDDAHILVAANELKMFPSVGATDFVGSDAGIWIPQLTGRKIIMLSYELDFLSTETISLLCQHQIDYIYIGNKAESFYRATLNERKEVYRKLLSLPNTQLYQFLGCP